MIESLLMNLQAARGAEAVVGAGAEIDREVGVEIAIAGEAREGEVETHVVTIGKFLRVTRNSSLYRSSICLQGSPGSFEVMVTRQGKSEGSIS